METKQEAFNGQREIGEKTFAAEMFHFEMDGTEYVEFRVDFLGGGSDERYDAVRERLGKRASSIASASTQRLGLRAYIFMLPTSEGATERCTTPGKTKAFTKHSHVRGRSV